VSIAQIVNPVLQTVFIVVIGLGYYYTTKAIRSQVGEMARETTAGGRPLIIVSEDLENKILKKGLVTSRVLAIPTRTPRRKAFSEP
jgi:hypothetical protein